MSDTQTDQISGDQTDGTTPAGGDEDVDPSAAISRGKGLSLDAVKPDSPAAAALEEFKALVARHQEAAAAEEALKNERNLAIRNLKDEHNVGFSAMAELIGGTSSLVLYLYERAAGKTAKQIREESIASRKAKEAARVDDPDRPAARKQTPEEKAFRKVQREALKAFLAEQRDKAAERGESTDEFDAGLSDAEREQAEDDADE